ncbi:collagen alpha-1(I) chain-like protein [Corchorus capsularis]|uniref:Collagen alpha-1(I) chain-like protein n=1 Tax=Corchorus capsularis TaxID=210143 RepID=A0A1R3JCN5_COCAP|nr:collagen alpha-1(I) chain-like protein [Corchorus capsularis]
MDPKSSVPMNSGVDLSFDGPLCQHSSLSCAVCCFSHGRTSGIPIHDASLCEGFVPATPPARGRALHRRRASTSLSPSHCRYPRLASVGSSSSASHVVGSCFDAYYPLLMMIPLIYVRSANLLPPTSPYLVDDQLALKDPTVCLIDVPIEVSCSTLASPMSTDPVEPVINATGLIRRKPGRWAVSKPVARLRCWSSPASRCSRRMRDLQAMDVAEPPSADGHARFQTHASSDYFVPFCCYFTSAVSLSAAFLLFI